MKQEYSKAISCLSFEIEFRWIGPEDPGTSQQEMRVVVRLALHLKYTHDSGVCIARLCEFGASRAMHGCRGGTVPSAVAPGQHQPRCVLVVVDPPLPRSVLCLPGISHIRDLHQRVT